MKILILASPVDWHTTQTPDFPKQWYHDFLFSTIKGFSIPSSGPEIPQPLKILLPKQSAVNKDVQRFPIPNLCQGFILQNKLHFKFQIPSSPAGSYDHQQDNGQLKLLKICLSQE